MAAGHVSGQIADEAGTVTPSNTAPNVWSYLWVGTAGALDIVTEAGDEVSLLSIPDGTFIWVRTSIIKASSTASNIVGFR